MKSPKTLLIVLLTLTTLGGAGLAWQQYLELVELRAAAMNRDERADLQKRLWDLEKANRDLQDRLAAARGGATDLESMLADVTEERSGERGDRSRGGRGDSGRGRGGPPPQMAAVRELMNKPEVQAMIASQQKAAIEARYGQLMKNLNLNADQANKFTALVGERQASGRDVYEAARAQGIDPRENPEAFRKLMTDARNEVENSIKSVLGDSGYAQLQNYEQTMPQRGVVNELQQRLTYSNNPLTAAQAEQLVQILAANTPPRPTTQTASSPGGPPSDGGPGRGGFMIRSSDLGMVNTLSGGGPGGPGGPGMGMIGAVLDSRPLPAPITPSAVVQAQGVLTQPQVAVLQQLQQQQATQQQLASIVRETLISTQPASGQTGTSTSGSSGTTTGGPGATPGAPPTRRSRPPGGGN